jgi:hypothetical protein
MDMQHVYVAGFDMDKDKDMQRGHAAFECDMVM